MKFIVSIICFIICGCAGSPLATGFEADKNITNMSDLEIGMTQPQVLQIMGKPYKQETKIIDHEEYTIWFYITEAVGLTQTRYISENFTPLIFSENVLRGWGYQYYNFLLDIDNAKGKRAEEKRQQYTDDPDEWPPQKTHAIIDMQAPPDEKKPPELQDVLESIIEEPSSSVQENMIPSQKQVGENPANEPSSSPEELPPEKKETVPQEQKIPECKDIEKDHPNYNWLD
ncbi:MAG: DUF3192 domain-containing protein [Parachlamydiales bacterium]|nr:DUF3192 domain-containing protein [Parachlamydiales bacterium]